MVFFYVADSHNSQIIKTKCPKTGDHFFLQFKRRISASPERLNIKNLRPGTIIIKTNPKIEDLEFELSDGTTVKAEKVDDNHFEKSLKTNLIVRSIKMFPKSSLTNRIDVFIYRKPVFSIFLISVQFLFLFVLFYVVLLTLSFLYLSIVKGQSPGHLPQKTLVNSMVVLFLTVFVFSVTYFDEFVRHFELGYPPGFFLKLLLVNMALAILLLLLFFAFSTKCKRETLPISLPIFVSLPVLFIRLPFSVQASADSLLWVMNISFKKMELSFAESLSLLLNKLNFHLFSIVGNTDPMTTMVYTGKIVGALFLFSLFFFVNSFVDFSYKKKLLFYLLFLTFGLTVLLFGFLEFRYYSLPFLVFSFLSAKKYIEDGGNRIRYLIGSAALAVIAGLFHGTAYFSLPVILLLPLFKKRQKNKSQSSISYLKQYSAILLAIGAVGMAFLATVSILGFELQFNTAAGGFDGRQFISFIPRDIHLPNAVNFLEVSYFLFAGWIIFITGSFIFLLLLFKWKRSLSLKIADFILWLFALSQLVIVLFWGFDNGVSEFDLYIAPPTLLYLFLMRSLLATAQPEKNAWKYIVLFSLLSPIYLLLTKTLGS